MENSLRSVYDSNPHTTLKRGIRGLYATYAHIYPPISGSYGADVYLCVSYTYVYAWYVGYCGLMWAYVVGMDRAENPSQ